MKKLYVSVVAVVAGLALVKTADASPFRTYPIIFCNGFDDDSYLGYTGQIVSSDVTYGVQSECPIFNDSNFNVRTATGVTMSFNGYQNASDQLGDYVCVTFAGGGGGYCGQEAQTTSTGLVHITAQDLSAFTSSHSTSTEDTFFMKMIVGANGASEYGSAWSYSFTSD